MENLSILSKAMVVLLLAVVVLIWFYLLARLVIRGALKSWYEFMKQNKNNKEDRDE